MRLTGQWGSIGGKGAARRGRGESEKVMTLELPPLLECRLPAGPEAVWCFAGRLILHLLGNHARSGPAAPTPKREARPEQRERVDDQAKDRLHIPGESGPEQEGRHVGLAHMGMVLEQEPDRQAAQDLILGYRRDEHGLGNKDQAPAQSSTAARGGRNGRRFLCQNLVHLRSLSGVLRR